MNAKTYKIDGHELRLKKYEDLTIKEEEEIDQILSFSTGEVELNPLTFLPKVLIADGQEEIDYKNASYKTIFEIMTDFLAERTLFLMNLPGMMKNLLGAKIGQISSTEKSTVNQNTSSQE